VRILPKKEKSPGKTARRHALCMLILPEKAEVLHAKPHLHQAEGIDYVVYGQYFLSLRDSGIFYVG